MNDALKLGLLALGADTDDADLALHIVVDALHAEAEVLASEDGLCTDSPQLLLMAHAKRLEALKHVINALKVRWAEPDASAIGIRRSFGKSEAAQ